MFWKCFNLAGYKSGAHFELSREYLFWHMSWNDFGLLLFILRTFVA